PRLSALAAVIAINVLPDKWQVCKGIAAIRPGAAAPCYERPMDGTVLALFLAATFVGGIATGLAGFAFGLIVSGVWLHVISPLQTTALIVFYGLFSQSYGIWTVRHSFNWR